MPNPPSPTLPPDDPGRALTISNEEQTDWIFLAGDVYGLIITGEQTAGGYCLIEMRVPPGGGPPPHRHDFEELFTILEGTITFTFRGEEVSARAGQSVNIPANAPHFFRNTSDAGAVMLCVCAPAGQDEYFRRVGVALDGPDAQPPHLSDAEISEGRRRAAELAASFRTQILSDGTGD